MRDESPTTSSQPTKSPCGNNDCDKCDPRPRWRIREHRIQHITYEREIKAATAEEAMRIFDEGTAWPSSYDDRGGEIIQQDAAVIEQITGEGNEGDARKLTFYREDCCYHDLPEKLEAAGLGHLSTSEALSTTNEEEFTE
jgi:hypothetical protein